MIYNANPIIDSSLSVYYKIAELIKQGNDIITVPYQTKVILHSMFSDNLIERPTFFELAFLLNLGHFYLMNGEERRVSKIFNANYETGNDFLYYSRSKLMIDHFHCLMFHWYHGNIEAVRDISNKWKDEDEFMSYIHDYLILYEQEGRIDQERKKELYSQFINLNFNDYRFWLMPPPNRMPKEIKQDGESESLGHFYRSYDPENCDPAYEAFFENEKHMFFESIKTKFFNICSMFPAMKKYTSLYFFVAHQNQDQSNFYYRFCNESEKEEIYNYLVRNAIEDEIVEVQKFIFWSDIFKNTEQRSILLSKLVSEKKITDPDLQFIVGMECIKQLDYENGRHFINQSAEQNYQLAIFYQSLLTFHGHCYDQEREESLKRMISLVNNMEDKYKLEVAMILLQGIDVEQDINNGERLYLLVRYCLPMDRMYHFKTRSFYYDLLDDELEFYSHNKESGKYEKKIEGNPKYMFNIGKQAFINKDYETAERCLKSATEQDYLEAEFVYSLMKEGEDRYSHLHRGAKGGCIEAQVLLGLSCIYEVQSDNETKLGIEWLHAASLQNCSLALEILSEIYSHGFRCIPIDCEKANMYKDRLKDLRKAKHSEIDQLLNSEIKNIVQSSDSNIFGIFTRYEEEIKASFHDKKQN